MKRHFHTDVVDIRMKLVWRLSTSVWNWYGGCPHPYEIGINMEVVDIRMKLVWRLSTSVWNWTRYGGCWHPYENDALFSKSVWKWCFVFEICMKIKEIPSQHFLESSKIQRVPPLNFRIFWKIFSRDFFNLFFFENFI